MQFRRLCFHVVESGASNHVENPARIHVHETICGQPVHSLGRDSAADRRTGKRVRRRVVELIREGVDPPSEVGGNLPAEGRSEVRTAVAGASRYVPTPTKLDERLRAGWSRAD